MLPKFEVIPLPETNLEVGKTVGDYEIIALLGHGGMGKVFKVRNVISDRVDAMKSLLSYGDGESEAAERFIREIKVLAKLEHPNITSFRTAFRANDEVLMIMEYVEGSSLSRKLVHHRLELWRAVDYASQVLSALSHAHHSGVLHRDVKPSNILIGADDRVKLTDFGIASLTADPGLTITGGTVGTLYYMSPEQMKALPLDGRADLYSVGVTLYEMVTGQVPFKGDSYYAILKAHLESIPVPPMDLVPGIPAELSDIIEKALEKAAVSPFSDGGGISGSAAGAESAENVGLRFHPYRDRGCPKPSCSVQNAFFSRFEVVGPGGARSRQEKPRRLYRAHGQGHRRPCRSPCPVGRGALPGTGDRNLFPARTARNSCAPGPSETQLVTLSRFAAHHSLRLQHPDRLHQAEIHPVE